MSLVDDTSETRIVFNGEIYNHLDLRAKLESAGHRFTTNTDTEVLLAAYQQWGQDCLVRLEGMFAFVIYDSVQRLLFAARDRSGEKPFYYSRSSTEFWFASELRALLANPNQRRILDPAALEYYLAYGYLPAAQSMITGIHKLPPAHALRYRCESGELKISRYWKLPRYSPTVDISDDEHVANVGDLLQESVAQRLHADVPVGILLSGGLDSSLVTAMAVRASSSKVRTFTIAFGGHGDLDEGPHARKVAEYFGTEHIELDAAKVPLELLKEIVIESDEPIGDSSIIPMYMVSRLIRPHATVAIGGDGGDELFGGYPHYNWLIQQEATGQRIPARIRKLMYGTAKRIMPVGARGRNYVLGMVRSNEYRMALVNRYLGSEMRRRLLAPRSWPIACPESTRQTLSTHGESILQSATRMDFSFYLPDDILVKVDRASMRTSLEVRAPFLDTRLVEYSYSSLPDRLRSGIRNRKLVLRKLARNVLPTSFDCERKQGFSVPMNVWFDGEWGSFCRNTLRQSQSGLFDASAVESLFDGQTAGRNNGARLFLLTALELWMRKYDVQLPDSHPG